MRCELCGHEDKSPTTLLEDVALIVDHFELMHPDRPLERWPDGEIVLHDTTLSIEDFT